MRKVRVAQIGVEHDHASAVFDTINRLNEYFDVVGYAVPENDSDTKCSGDGCLPVYKNARRLTEEEILSDHSIDAVIVETSELNLAATAVKYAERGMHIHMDKPGGIARNDFYKLIDTMNSTGKVFHTGYMYRYNPAVIELQNMIKQRQLGDILYTEAQMNCWHKPSKRQWLERFPGGMTFFLGCHLTDLILMIQGIPDKITPVNRSSGTDGLASEDVGMVLFEYPSGISFLKTTAIEIGGYMRRQLVVAGTEGTVEIKPFEYNKEISDEKYMFTDMTVTTDKKWHSQSTTKTFGPFGRYDEMMRDFALTVLGERQSITTYEYEKLLYDTVLKTCDIK